MTVLNVQDFGAVGDGSTDDTAAIQDAIDAAGDGDEVYVPATGSSYLVTGWDSIIDVDSSNDGVRLYGNGRESRIEYAGGNDGRNVFMVSVDPGDEGLEGFVLEHLTLDGGLDSVDGDPNVASAVQVRSPESGAEGNVDITVRDVRATNCYGNGIDVGAAGTTVVNCTAENNRQHGFGMETSYDPFQDPPVRFERCLSRGNGFGGGYYGMDLSGGKAVAEDCVLRDNEGAGATKCSVGSEHMVYRRCRLASNEGHTFQNTSGEGATVVFDRIVAEDNVDCMRLTEDGVYRVPAGSELVFVDNGPDVRGGLYLTHESVLEAGDATLWINGQTGGAGLRASSDGSGSRVGTYYHANNEDGAVSNDQHISFGTVASDLKTDLDAVPTADQVGAWTGAKSDAGSDDGTTDDGSTDDSPFEAWTPRWDADASDWGVVAGDEYEGGHALRYDHDGTDVARRAISWDAVGTPSDVEVLDRVRVPSFDADGDRGYHARVHLRSSYAGGEELGYWIELEDAEDGFRLAKYSADGMETLARFGTPAEGTFFYRRFRAEGDRLRVKVWEATESEPDGWDVDTTDADHADGWVGLGSFDPGAFQTDVLGVATDGGTVQLESDAAQPTVSWRGPVDGDTVGGSVPVRIEAADGAGSSEGVTVEYRAAGGSWTATTYDAESDTHEATWDSTDVAAGDVSLEARATSDDGSTAGATVSVTVDNDPEVVSLEARDLTADGATLAGDLRDLGGDDEVRVRFELRAADTDAWTAVGGETLGSPSEFTHIVSGLNPGGAYEFRAVADGDNATVSGEAVPFATREDADGNDAPTVDRFEVTDRSGNKWTRFDVDWAVTDGDGDLDAVVSTLKRNGRTVAAESTTVSGDSASYTHVLRVRGKVDAVHLCVNDTSNATAMRKRDI
ncbi:right-handed parallel beta-helix repeat-containing protein [Halorubrum salsamenti]|uniref:right-handed parallel beta-helix repeat-containing protein n=1 Tax=Halorubrum salsamenti TaxID=2583990 RepID=UPI0011A5C498|nr:right-handed parallel beta-helix repeat-containing protein [Halorubrum salsamenti]